MKLQDMRPGDKLEHNALLHQSTTDHPESVISGDDEWQEICDDKRRLAHKLLRVLIETVAEHVGDTVNPNRLYKVDLVKQYALAAQLGQIEAAWEIVEEIERVLQLGLECEFSGVETGVYDNAIMEDFEED